MHEGPPIHPLDNNSLHLSSSVSYSMYMVDQNSINPKLGNTPLIQNEVVDIEKELLNEIIIRLDQNKMSPEDAQKLAKEFLSLLPIHDQKDLLQKLYTLSKKNNAMTGIYLEYAKPHEENETQRKLALMSQHLHAGKIEEALAVAKGGLANA